MDGGTCAMDIRIQHTFDRSSTIYAILPLPICTTLKTSWYPMKVVVQATFGRMAILKEKKSMKISLIWWIVKRMEVIH